MKVLEIYNQHRRDCHVDMECQSCKTKQTITTGYDDSNYWVNIVPNMKCKKCGKSTIDLNLYAEEIKTKYPEGMQV